MPIYESLALVLYFLVLLTIAFLSHRQLRTASDFIIGGRSLNCWLTALAAHASDMGSWLFMAYPAAIFTSGLIGIWTAVGLVLCMFLNWQLVAPKIRVATEKFNSLTFSSFFESRLADTSGLIRIFSAIILIVFYTIYISAALTGLGALLQVLFNFEYITGILIGILIVIPYVFTGGYLTLAWIDLFQGFFLMGVIIFVPCYLLPHVGGFSAIAEGISTKNLTSSMFPDFSKGTVISIISMTLGWGLGYFGQPHIVTKFMGIRKVSDMAKSKWIGMSWMVIALGAATFVGAVSIAFFKNGIDNSEYVFINMVKQSFHPFVIGFILCAMLAAIINQMGSQVLVLSSSLTEDFYKRLSRKKPSSKRLLLVSRLGIIAVTAIAFLIASKKTNSINALVEYAWSGIGSSFGPLVIFSLYSRKINKYGAWAGILSGGIIAGIWPYFNKALNITLSPMIPGFLSSIFFILLISRLTRHKLSTRV